MKIKTITCHNVFNFGASLQAFALMNYLTSLGHNVEIIDYMPSYIRKNLGLFAIGPKYKRNIFIALAFYCYVVPIRIMQYKARRKFKLFLDEYLHLTKRYNSFKELNEMPPLADVYFCGSDQIWNTNINNGLDPAFYLGFCPYKSTKASYAASFSISEIPQEHHEFVKDMLNNLDFISVRERTGLEICKDFGFRNAKIVCDPVFLIDKSQWLSMVYKPKYENYIFVYDQENSSSIRNLALALSKQKGMKIVALKNLYPMRWADFQEKNAGPIDFISLIANADIVISNSFHCTAFSIILERQFFVINRTHQKVNSRMKDLLSLFRISNRMINDFEEIKNGFIQINYENIKPILNEIKKQSKAFINNVLNSAQTNNK